MQKSTSNASVPPKVEEFTFDQWTLRVKKSHIMRSLCSTKDACTKASNEEEMCTVCRYENGLSLPSLPDMVFSDNTFEIIHSSGASIEFNAFDALKEVGECPHHIQVAHAKTWQDARSDCEHSKNIVKNYDWTYSTSYAGTVKGLETQRTDQRIDLNKLKIQEEIKFYQEVFLYEDELDDNGSTRCSVKVRVMPSGFFAVFRHYLRVDHVMVKVTDTRLYHSAGDDFILRESSIREKSIDEIKVDPEVYKNPDLVWQYLPITSEKVDKLLPPQM